LIKKNIKSNVDDTEYDFYGDLDLFFIDNREDLAEFIKLHYRGRVSETNKIPYKLWFIYHVDDSGDSIWEQIFLLEDYKTELLKSIIESTLLYKQLQDIQ